MKNTFAVLAESIVGDEIISCSIHPTGRTILVTVGVGHNQIGRRNYRRKFTYMSLQSYGGPYLGRDRCEISIPTKQDVALSTCTNNLCRTVTDITYGREKLRPRSQEALLRSGIGFSETKSGNQGKRCGDEDCMPCAQTVFVYNRWCSFPPQ